jgi:glycosyltransferase involved in cell wall biosynthesis
MNGEYVIYGQKASKTQYDLVFCFALPFQCEIIENYYKKLASRFILMTVCETDTVHESYGQLLNVSKIIYCPSSFACDVLKRQFPQGTYNVLHHWAKPMPLPKGTPEIIGPYKFYTIGNIADPRKNINMLLEVFQMFDPKNVKLVIKATCNQLIEIKIPGVTVINGLLSDDHMEAIHNGCHCYINCSHSEGVGMGAVEAALRSKPVIITDYGGLKEYVKTPWIVECKKGSIGFDDFLFTKDLIWGHPDKQMLYNKMKELVDLRVSIYPHSHTRNLMNDLQSKILEMFHHAASIHAHHKLQ